MKIDIVTTTINYPKFLSEYSKGVYKNSDDIQFIIIGDNKTPKDFQQYVDAHNRLTDWKAIYFDMKDQVNWINQNLKHKNLNLILPQDSPRRRNFGYLYSIWDKADIMITIDDDNFPIESGIEWVNGHVGALTTCKRPIISSCNGFINPCHYIISNDAKSETFYSRGYPISECFSDSFDYSERINEKKVVMNLGLWSKKPDVDAYTNILYPDLDGILPEEGDNFIVAPDNYIPICTQNTSVSKEFLPVFNVVHQEQFMKQAVDRYDDIWGGLIANKIAHECKRAVSFGTPFARHERNSHNYTNDLQKEMYGIILNQKMWKWIRDIPINSTIPIECYLELSEWMLYGNPFNSIHVDKYINNLSKFMKDWIGAVECLM